MEQLLTTKFFIPSPRPELVPRSRLINRLNEGLQHKLTLISAPAGFGKTTLISDWVENFHFVADGDNHNGYRIAWLSLDDSDNDPTRFLAYFITALNRATGIGSDPADGALARLQSPQPPPVSAILTSLINEVAEVSADIIFVLDDYHTIESSAIDDAMAFFLENMPPQIRIVIATRVDPPLPLARLRARAQLIELRASDLRFTMTEAAEFLNQRMGLSLAPEDVSVLENRTEGWIAGLQLAALSLQGKQDTAERIKSLNGSPRFVLDYLIEEVFEQQPEEIQTFLLLTSILNRLTGPLVEEITGQEGGHATLERLYNCNLFIVALDEEHSWFRYHRLFADLLRRRLYQTAPEKIRGLHRLASGWFARSGFTDASIEHALRGGDYQQAASLIEQQFDATYQRGEHMKLRHWLAAFPVELVFSIPHLCILQAWNLFTGGQMDAADRSLRVAELLIDPAQGDGREATGREDRLTEDDRMKLAGRVAAIRAFIASNKGDFPGTIEYARQALAHLPEQEAPWRSAALIALGDAFASRGDMEAAYEARSGALLTSEATCDFYLLMIANLRLAETLRQQGELQQVIDICEEQMETANISSISNTVVAGWLLAIWGEALAERHELDRALELARKGVELTERGRDVAMIGWSNLCLVRVLFSSGDMTGADEVIHKLDKKAQEFDLPLWIPIQNSAWQARVWLKQGKREAVADWIDARGLEVEGDIPYPHEIEYILLARFLIAEGRLDEASGLLKRLLLEANLRGHVSREIELLILLSLAEKSNGDPGRAVNTLEQAISLAQSEGFTQVFVDEGPPMASLLYEVWRHGTAEEYIHRLLAAFSLPGAEPGGGQAKRVSEFDLVEPLSEREIEVLRLISEGLTNQEVASELYLALNTVKSHTRNIYGKLGVKNRTQAVTRARILGIIPVN